MRICQIIPYHTGSHAAWADNYRLNTRHQMEQIKLSGRFWKWRMHGGAVSLSRMFQDCEHPDIILTTDMLDVSTFRALTRERTWNTPVAMYMHENQLTYPPAPGEKLDLHYGFINYASMLASDAILFNSQFHMDSWFKALPNLLKHFPDYNELETVDTLRQRTEVLPLGLNLSPLDTARPVPHPDGPLNIVWNHRWEHDKNPESFFEALFALQDMNIPFKVILLGEHFVRTPKVFEQAKERLGQHIVQFGYVNSAAEYAQWLWRADVIVSTAYQEFFGAAVVEGMYCDCWPILPDRLSYPQFIPNEHTTHCLYAEDKELVSQLVWATEHLDWIRTHSLRDRVIAYDWKHMAPLYDERLEDLATQKR